MTFTNSLKNNYTIWYRNTLPRSLAFITSLRLMVFLTFLPLTILECLMFLSMLFSCFNPLLLLSQVGSAQAASSESSRIRNRSRWSALDLKFNGAKCQIMNLAIWLPCGHLVPNAFIISAQLLLVSIFLLFLLNHVEFSLVEDLCWQLLILSLFC